MSAPSLDLSTTLGNLTKVDFASSRICTKIFVKHLQEQASNNAVGFFKAIELEDGMRFSLHDSNAFRVFVTHIAAR